MKPISMTEIRELEVLMRKDREELGYLSWNDYPMVRLEIMGGGRTLPERLGIQREDFEDYFFLWDYCHRRGTGETELASFPSTVEGLAQSVEIPSDQLPEFTAWIENNIRAFDDAWTEGLVCPYLFPDVGDEVDEFDFVDRSKNG